MRTFYGVAIAAALLMASGSQAQTVQKPVKAVQLSKVVFSPDASKLTQKVKVGTICLFSGSPLNFGSQDRTANFERFERLFDATMQKNGFTVIAKSSNLFEGADDGPNADFLIGATFRPETINICDSASGVKGSVGVVVEWQVYDRAKKQVVETVTTKGMGERLKFDRTGLAGMFDDAFTNALTALIELGVVKKHLDSAAL